MASNKWIKEFTAEVALSLAIMAHIARAYLQPHYGNGVFGNVYLSAGHTPPRTPRISRLKSQILKPTFLS